MRQQYEHLKKDLAIKYPYDIESYCDGKEDFVREIEKLALMEYDDTWDRLYLAARKALSPRTISPYIEAGQVAAALLTAKGNIYTGVCIDTACSLGMCAEKKCNRTDDNEQRTPDPQTGHPFLKRKNRSTLRFMSRAHDAIRERSRQGRNSL